MELNDRKKLILQTIIDEYISSAEPVGSRAISKHKELGVSSATIRNEMADLEEMGYLLQPHTSSGRIPSDAGYRFYVNSLMKRYRMGIEAIEELQRQLAGRIRRLDRAVRRAGYLASALTDYTTVVSAASAGAADIKKIDLVPIAERTVMLIIVTGGVKNSVLKTELDAGECESLAALLNEKLRGKTAEDISVETINEIQLEACRRFGAEPKVLVNIMHYIYEAVSEDDDAEIYVENAKSILRYPEYRDVNKAREMLSLLEDKSKVRQLMSGIEGDGVNARIGTENDSELLKDCSIVTVNYSLDGKAAGKLGVIGPKRMNYEKVFASLDLISNEIERLMGYMTIDDS